MAETGLRARALRYLAQREHSRAELARKLADHGSAPEIDALLDRLSELELLSDARFAAAWVQGKAARFGTARLRHDLAHRGVSDALIEAALQSEAVESELERAHRVWRTRFAQPPANAREWARQARFLRGRGFAAEVIRKLLKEIPDESAQG